MNSKIKIAILSGGTVFLIAGSVLLILCIHSAFPRLLFPGNLSTDYIIDSCDNSLLVNFSKIDIGMTGDEVQKMFPDPPKIISSPLIVIYTDSVDNHIRTVVNPAEITYFYSTCDSWAYYVFNSNSKVIYAEWGASGGSEFKTSPEAEVYDENNPGK